MDDQLLFYFLLQAKAYYKKKQQRINVYIKKELCYKCQETVCVESLSGPENDVHSRVSIDDLAELAKSQRKGDLLERFLHLPLAKSTQISITLS